MLKRLTSLLLLLFVSSPLAAATRRDQITREVEAMKPKLVECRRDIHMHPELSNREERTSRLIADRLGELGIPYDTGLAKYGVMAKIAGKQPGKIVLVRADIDALPIEETIDVPYKSLNKGVKHACGHDAHTTIALGTAELLWKHRNEFHGTAYVLFQPAEEGSPAGEEGGAELMVKNGLLEEYKPEAAFALHADPMLPVGQIGWKPGPQSAAADRFLIRITGKGSHGAYPNQGIDPIVIGAQVVEALQTIASRRVDPLEPVVVTVGSFHGGTRSNIIPDTVTLEGTIRALSTKVREQAESLVDSIPKAIAAAAGGSAEVTIQKDAPVMANDEKVGTFGERSAQQTLGNGNVQRVSAAMTAEDFGYISERIPSFYFKLGVANPMKGITAMVHTAQFDIDEDALLVGTRVMTNLVLDYLGAK